MQNVTVAVISILAMLLSASVGTVFSSRIAGQLESSGIRVRTRWSAGALRGALIYGRLAKQHSWPKWPLIGFWSSFAAMFVSGLVYFFFGLT
jgi:hypothetical protein